VEVEGMARAVMIVGTRPSDPSREREFNEWYETTHVPELCQVPGIASARRFELSKAQLFPPDAAQHEYIAIYEIDADDVQGVIDELATRMASGAIHMSDAVEMDPLPSVALYEETAKAT
jgi:hypothetical protein